MAAIVLPYMSCRFPALTKPRRPQVRPGRVPVPLIDSEAVEHVFVPAPLSLYLDVEVEVDLSA